MKVFLYTNAAYAEQISKQLEGEGLRVHMGRVNDDPKTYTQEELIKIAKENDAMMVTSHNITRNVMESSHRLLTIAKWGIGVEKIDLKAATDLGILVSSTPVPENYLAVAEGAIARILALAKRLKEDETKLRKGEWKTLQNSFVQGKTIGIIGLGRIGSQVSKLLQPWRVKIIAYDKYVSREKAEALNVELVDFKTLLSSSDFITAHIILTSETEKMMGLEQFQSMKRTAYFVNTSRGGIVDEAALCKVLKEGRIAGAALDVFAKEPVDAENPLLDPALATKLVLTCHTSTSTPEARMAMAMAHPRNCMAALRGQVPDYVNNPEVLPKWRERLKERGIESR
jgi:D-3-phosphoglycerate dehydrogenase